MRAFVPLFLVIVFLLIVGCVQIADQNNSGGQPQEQTASSDQNAGTSPDPTQKPAGTGNNALPATIKILSAPAMANANEQIVVSWKIDSEQRQTNNTAVLYGPNKVPNPKNSADYPDSTSSLCGYPACSIPNPFSARFEISNAGTYFFRAHAIVEGKDIWSEERAILINPAEPVRETKSFSIVADDNGYYVNNKIDSIAVKKGSEIEILFMVKSFGVEQAGLYFSGCGKKVSGIPANSVQMSFIVENDCTISSFGASTNEKKADLLIKTQ